MWDSLKSKIEKLRRLCVRNKALLAALCHAGGWGR